MQLFVCWAVKKSDIAFKTQNNDLYFCAFPIKRALIILLEGAFFSFKNVKIRLNALI